MLIIILSFSSDSMGLPGSRLPVLCGGVTRGRTCALVLKGENLILFLSLLIESWGLTPWKSWENYYHQLCVAKCCFSSLSASVIFTVIHFFITPALLRPSVFEAPLSLPGKWLQNEVIWFFFKWKQYVSGVPHPNSLCSCRAFLPWPGMHVGRMRSDDGEFCWKPLSSLGYVEVKWSVQVESVAELGLLLCTMFWAPANGIWKW